MSQQQKCSQCLLQFTLANLPRIMPTCEHDICTKCLKQAIQNRQEFIDCQYCAKKIKRKDIKLFPKNMKLIEKIKLNVTSSSSKNQEKSNFTGDLSPRKQQNTDKQQKQEDQLLIYYEQGTQQQNQFLKDECQIHNKPYDIICATDKMRICAHCAIFGNHKDHRFRTIIQFQNEIKQKMEYFSSIIAKKQVNIYPLKIQGKQKQQNLHNLKINLNLKLQARKQLLSKEIQKSFQALIQSIKNQKKVIDQELQEKFNLTLNKILQSLSDEPKLKKNYSYWQRSCQDVINKLTMTNSTKNRVEIYYDSPLEICEEGEIHFQEMIKNLRKFNKENQQKVNSICLKVQEIPITNFMSLVFPTLQQNSLSKQILKIQQSFQNDFLSLRNNKGTKQDLNQNSFIFDPELSAIHFNSSLQKRQNKKDKVNDKMNRSITSMNSNRSFNSIKNIQSVFNKTPVSSANKKQMFTSKNIAQKQKQKAPLNISKAQISYKKPISSPDVAKHSPNSNKNKKPKTPEQILIQFASNDFINQVDLSQLQLNDKYIKQYLIKLTQIRHLKALKLHKNQLTDQGFQSICQYLPHVFNLNLSHNNLTDKILDIILKNKNHLYKMRIINLSNNKLTTDRSDYKIKGKLEQIKKMGLMVTF